MHASGGGVLSKTTQEVSCLHHYGHAPWVIPLIPIYLTRKTSSGYTLEPRHSQCLPIRGLRFYIVGDSLCIIGVVTSRQGRSWRQVWRNKGALLKWRWGKQRGKNRKVGAGIHRGWCYYYNDRTMEYRIEKHFYTKTNKGTEQEAARVHHRRAQIRGKANMRIGWAGRDYNISSEAAGVNVEAT